MDDLIKRQDAINACLDGWCACVKDCVDEIKKLPSAEPVQKTGKWNDIGGVIRWGCPICHHAYEVKSNYCPNCGARMECEEE